MALAPRTTRSTVGGVPADPNAEWWTIADVAEFLGVRDTTVSTYYLRGQMPQPDNRFARSPVWRPSTVVEWNRQRPGRGWRATREKDT